jgi:hypothetical protein
MKYIPKIVLFAALALMLASCNLEKEIEIDLPDYNNQPVVECYLEADKPFSLTLTSSNGYFAPFDTGVAFITNQLINDATVSISHNGVVYPLVASFGFTADARLYNYVNPALVPADFTNDFELNITLKNGKTITGKTRMLPVVPIDSIVNELVIGDSLARQLTYFTDDVNNSNYYRRMLHFVSLDSLLFDFTLDDRLSEPGNGKFVTGSLPRFKAGDTTINTLFHIDKAYNDFLRSIQGAVSANQNPFAQPGVILSNVSGTANPIGIFTCLSYQRIQTIIEL